MPAGTVVAYASATFAAFRGALVHEVEWNMSDSIPDGVKLMNALRILAIGAAASIFMAPLAYSQAPTFEARGGAVILMDPIVESPDRQLATDDYGSSWTVTFGLNVTPIIGLTIGYGNHAFDCEPDCTARTSGLEVGLRGVWPLSFLVRPWFSGGLLLHNFHLRDTPPIPADPAWAVAETSQGISVGAGLEVPVRRSLVFTPGIRYFGIPYQAREVDQFAVPGELQDQNLRFIVAEIGIRFLP